MLENLNTIYLKDNSLKKLCVWFQQDGATSHIARETTNAYVKCSVFKPIYTQIWGHCVATLFSWFDPIRLLYLG